jgi:hypothetical protein
VQVNSSKHDLMNKTPVIAALIAGFLALCFFLGESSSPGSWSSELFKPFAIPGLIGIIVGNQIVESLDRSYRVGGGAWQVAIASFIVNWLVLWFLMWIARSWRAILNDGGS